MQDFASRHSQRNGYSEANFASRMRLNNNTAGTGASWFMSRYTDSIESPTDTCNAQQDRAAVVAK